MNKLILEEIQRMNLLSKYDTSKTLSEQQWGWEPSNYLSSFSPTGQSNKQPVRNAIPWSVAAAPTATTPTATTPTAANKSNWDDVVKYYEGNTDPNWVFDKKSKEVHDNETYEYVKVNSKDTNDTDAFMKIWNKPHAVAIIYYKGQATGTSNGTWEWDGKKPVIKLKDISKGSSGYVQPTDTDWSAITKDNKVIGLHAKGPLVKELQYQLADFGYTGETGSPITTDVKGCSISYANCDGIYGPSTRAMVIKYQKDNDLSVDGIVGKQTYGAMFDW